MKVKADQVIAGANLKGADLSGFNFNGFELYEIRFDRANLRGADFRGAKVGGGWDLTEIDQCTYGPWFDGADLRDAKFCGSSLTFTSFKNADVRGADFSDTDFAAHYSQSADALNSGPDFTGAIYDVNTIWPENEPPDGVIKKT